MRESNTIGWQPTCTCYGVEPLPNGDDTLSIGLRRARLKVWARLPVVPQIVFDPFIGSGTVGKVAESFGRRWTGTDLGYHDLSRKRTGGRSLFRAFPGVFDDL